MTNFDKLLKEIGITRKEFAEAIGISYKSMNVMLSTSEPKWVKSALLVADKLKPKQPTYNPEF